MVIKKQTVVISIFKACDEGEEDLEGAEAGDALFDEIKAVQCVEDVVDYDDVVNDGVVVGVDYTDEEEAHEDADQTHCDYPNLDS